MDISILGNQSIRIKGKKVTFIVDPMKDIPKTPADAIVLLNGINGKNNIDMSRVTDSRIVIDGPGGYEVGGAKMSGILTPNGTLYRLSVDDIDMIIGNVTESKAEGFNSCQVLIVNANEGFSESFVTALEPKITVLYGDKKNESAKTLGLESITSTPKVTVVKDKLPEKMEIFILG